MKPKVGGSVFKRGERYWIKYYVGGKAVRESAGATEKEAGDKLKTRWKEIFGDRFVGPDQEKLTVGELLDDYLLQLKLKGAKSLQKTTLHAKSIRDAFGFERAVLVTSERVDRFIEERCKQRSPVRPGATLAPATVNRAVAVLRQALNWARKRGRLTRVPHFTKLKEALPRQGFLEAGDFEEVAANLPEHVQDAARFAYATGWRRGEVLGLTWDQVNLSAEQPEVRLPTSKNDRPRSLPLVEELLEIVERRWEARKLPATGGEILVAEYVFHRNGKPLRDFRRAWKLACGTAGIRGQLWHDMRRSAVRNMVRAGVPESVAMGVSGHVTSAIFKRYDIVSLEDKAEALRKTAEHLAARKTRTVVPIRKRESS